ncbi:hypothetical protein K435DRAFT_789066 [Dendrothele bispora CBS 962.96]|uniref:Uncharacterized protein n=1 Tax=Dendrothele bispora (strain CBS 962.96) TaxID=1314807 RepID=A0A4S8MV37_DENBC|nr:hypothetical protein K435DRAFT_789066 [Dendrothele bispora CBS 962.96]
MPVKVTLSICLLGSFVGTSLDFGLLVKRVMGNFVVGNKITTATLAVPLISTNFTATTLIGFKAWHHFQDIRRNLESTNRSPKSGLLYLAFWIVYLVLGFTKGGNSTVSQGYLAIMPGLVAVYQILIILVVANENNKPESVNDMSLSQSIRFASVRASTSEDHHSVFGGESQLAYPAASINNNAEVEGNDVEVVSRMS